MDSRGEATERSTARASADFWLIPLVYVAYEYLRDLASGRASVAHRHADLILRLTPGPVRRFESELRAATLHHPAIHALADAYYAALHLSVTAAVLIWAWWRHPEEYRTYRSVLAVVTVAALLIFWLFPVAPPRLMPGLEAGAFDPSATWGGFENPYAAFPSLHLAWAAWCAWAVGRHLPPGRAALAWLYPLVTAMVLVGTANHYTLDLVGAAALLAVPVGAATWRLGRGRPGPGAVPGGRRRGRAPTAGHRGR